jgi:hypothetical protein
VTAAICTLFEGDYHLGLGALANSAYQNGWRGTLYAGYRGALPPWASSAAPAAVGSVLNFSRDAAIHFIPLTTPAHLTNYKPDFMLEVWNTVAAQADAMFYFDPDIVLHCPWKFFEEWVSYGVALCEDVNSPVGYNHPRRAGWKRYFAPHGIALRDVTEAYVNGGFVGVAKADKAFLRTWMEVQKAMARDLGDLRRANLGGKDRLDESRTPPTYMFNCTDQDALNAAVMATHSAASIMGAAAMDFKPGGYVMAHALGVGKPWRKNYLLHSLEGMRPQLVDHYYWSSVLRPIAVHSSAKVKFRKLQIALGGLIGRFYRKA